MPEASAQSTPMTHSELPCTRLTTPTAVPLCTSSTNITYLLNITKFKTHDMQRRAPIVPHDEVLLALALALLATAWCMTPCGRYPRLSNRTITVARPRAGPRGLSKQAIQPLLLLLLMLALQRFPTARAAASHPAAACQQPPPTHTQCPVQARQHQLPSMEHLCAHQRPTSTVGAARTLQLRANTPLADVQ